MLQHSVNKINDKFQKIPRREKDIGFEVSRMTAKKKKAMSPVQQSVPSHARLISPKTSNRVLRERLPKYNLMKEKLIEMQKQRKKDRILDAQKGKSENVKS